ncbi:MAG: hypothetical protein HY646_04340, partial [Acidobacteria bacterium]|nr:hypothetical protein [Acidobacteriota bacterium]
MTSHVAAGKLQGLKEDAYWYEAAFVAGITNAINVVADSMALPDGSSFMKPVSESDASGKLSAVFADIRAFYQISEVPRVFRIMAREPGYLADFWAATRRTFSDNQLSRRLKEALAFAVSLTTRSGFGTAFHLEQMRKL